MSIILVDNKEEKSTPTTLTHAYGKFIPDETFNYQLHNYKLNENNFLRDFLNKANNLFYKINSYSNRKVFF